MPRNDRSDSLSVRGDDDPRRDLKTMQQETELELGASEARDSGGVEHQSRADREGVDRSRRPEEQATADRTATSEGQHEQRREPGAPRRPPLDTGLDETTVEAYDEPDTQRTAPDAPGANEHP